MQQNRGRNHGNIDTAPIKPESMREDQDDEGNQSISPLVKGRKAGLIKIATGLDLNDSIIMHSAEGQSPSQSPQFVGTQSKDQSPLLVLNHDDQIPNSRNGSLVKLKNIAGQTNPNNTYESKESKEEAQDQVVKMVKQQEYTQNYTKFKSNSNSRAISTVRARKNLPIQNIEIENVENSYSNHVSNNNSVQLKARSRSTARQNIQNMISSKQTGHENGINQDKIIKIKAKDIKFNLPNSNLDIRTKQANKNQNHLSQNKEQTPQDMQSYNTITVDKQQSAQFYFTGSSILGDQQQPQNTNQVEENTDDSVKIHQMNSTLSVSDNRQNQNQEQFTTTFNNNGGQSTPFNIKKSLGRDAFSNMQSKIRRTVGNRQDENMSTTSKSSHQSYSPFKQSRIFNNMSNNNNGGENSSFYNQPLESKSPMISTIGQMQTGFGSNMNIIDQQQDFNQKVSLNLKPIISNTGSIRSSGLKDIRTLDRATILEEIEQNKMEEIRSNLSANKQYFSSRKYSNFNKYQNQSSSNSQSNNKYSSQHKQEQMVNSSLVNHAVAANESLNMQNILVKQDQQINISRIGGLGMMGLAAATTASQTTLNNMGTSQETHVRGRQQANMSINSGTGALGGENRNQTSIQNSMDLSPSFQYSRAALLKLKESSQSPIIENENTIQNKAPLNLQSQYKYHQNQPVNLIQQSSLYSPDKKQSADEKVLAEKQFRQKLNQSRQNQILNRKLSSVLDASPLKNSFIGKIIHDRYQNSLQQQDGQLTLETILNETLLKLKNRKNNKSFLKPLKNVENNSQNNQGALQEDNNDRYNSKQRLHDSYVKDISNGSTLNFKGGLTQLSNQSPSPKNLSGNKSKNMEKKETNPSRLNMLNILNESQPNNLNNTQELKVDDQNGGNEKEDIDLGVLDELTEQDRFFLIQQIEDLNKNIRYCHNTSPYNIFQEDEEQIQSSGGPIISEQPTILGKKRGSSSSYLRNHKQGSMRGVNKGLDIILDEEEDNLEADLTEKDHGDLSLKQHIREDSPEFTIRNNVSLRQDGSICFFGADEDLQTTKNRNQSDNEEPQQTLRGDKQISPRSVLSSIEIIKQKPEMQRDRKRTLTLDDNFDADNTSNRAKENSQSFLMMRRGDQSHNNGLNQITSISQLKQIKVFGESDDNQGQYDHQKNNIQIVIKSRPPSGQRRNQYIAEEDEMMEMEEMPLKDYDDDD